MGLTFKSWHMSIALGCGLMLTAIASAVTWFVDASATGTESGSSWTNAFTDLQDALDEADPDNNDLIWVAAGIYKPTKRINPNDVRSATYLIDSALDGIKIYGGFVGGETALAQ